MNQLTIATHEAKLALWSERIQECHESGMSVKDWCRSQGISDKTYYYWFRKLKQEAFDKLPEEQREKLFRKSRTVFSEVKKPVCISNSSDTAVSVFKNDLQIDIKNHADPTTVKMVLDLLGQTC